MQRQFISHETKQKQRAYILSELQSGRVFTNRDMQQIDGIANPWSRVSELRQKGHQIQTIFFQDIGRQSSCALYWLPTDGVETYHRHIPTSFGLDATVKYTFNQLNRKEVVLPKSQTKLILNNLLGR